MRQSRWPRIPAWAWVLPLVALGAGYLWRITQSGSVSPPAASPSDTLPVTAVPPPSLEPAAPPAVASLLVTPGSFSLPLGQTFQLTATATDSLGRPVSSAVITWATDDATIALVSPEGLVTARAPGIARIMATSAGYTSAIAVTIPRPPAPEVARTQQPAAPTVARIAVNPEGATLAVGDGITFGATPLDAAGSALTREVSWRSDDPGVATVDGAGKAVALAEGTARITATASGRSATVLLTVTPVPVASVAITPAQSRLVVGESVSLAVVARDAAGNVLEGRHVNWNARGSAASVTPDGVVTGNEAGSVRITAVVGSQRATADVTVVAAPVVAPPPAAPDPAADRRAITAALDAYARAVESRDIDQLRRAYPGMTSRQEGDWRSFFRNVSQVAFAVTVTQIQINGDTARADFDAVQTYRADRSYEQSASFVALLERTAGGWRITSID
jgi:uncharacterized protein YjdB